MNCERFQMVADDLARNEKRELPAGSPGGLMVVDLNERAGALAHVADCESCAQTLTAQNELSEGLHSLAEQMNTLQAPAHLEAQLLAAQRSRSRIHSTQPRWRYWVTAVAAVLLVVLGLMVWRWQTSSVPQLSAELNSNGVIQQKPASLLVPTGIIQPATQPSEASDQPSNPTPKRIVRKASRSGRLFAAAQLAKHDKGELANTEPANDLAANTELSEVATDFVSVGYGSALDLQEGGQLVRVELPRLALAQFGLPVNMDRVDERVKADVLVGADGVARAIRFVMN